MIFVEELLLTHVDCDGEADVDVEASVIRSRIFFIVSKTKWICILGHKRTLATFLSRWISDPESHYIKADDVGTQYRVIDSSR